MSTLPWFRMYAEFLTDPVIRMLSFEDQRHFVAALCMKAAGTLDKRYVTPALRRAVISQVIGLDSTDTKNTLDAANERLRKLGLVTEDWQPVNWDKRQYKSDVTDPTAAERMRRYRNKTVTPPNENVTLRPSESDTDTDTDKKPPRKRQTSEAVPFPATLALDEVMRQRALKRAPDCDVEEAFSLFRAYHVAHETRLKNWRSAWVTWTGNFDRFGYPKQRGSNGQVGGWQ